MVLSYVNTRGRTLNLRLVPNFQILIPTRFSGDTVLNKVILPKSLPKNAHLFLIFTLFIFFIVAYLNYH